MTAEGESSSSRHGVPSPFDCVWDAEHPMHPAKSAVNIIATAICRRHLRVSIRHLLSLCILPPNCDWVYPHEMGSSRFLRIQDASRFPATDTTKPLTSTSCCQFAFYPGMLLPVKLRGPDFGISPGLSLWGLRSSPSSNIRVMPRWIRLLVSLPLTPRSQVCLLVVCREG